MQSYQGIKAIAFMAIPTLCANGLLAIFAAVSGNIPMLFTAVCGALAAFTVVCMVDSMLAEHGRIYRRAAR